MANELEMSSQARRVERDKNELPWKDDLNIHTSVKSTLELCGLYLGGETSDLPPPGSTVGIHLSHLLLWMGV